MVSNQWDTHGLSHSLSRYSIHFLFHVKSGDGTLYVLDMCSVGTHFEMTSFIPQMNLQLICLIIVILNHNPDVCTYNLINSE